MAKTKEQRRQARLTQKLTRLAHFTAALAVHVVHGMPKASEEMIQQRFAICQGCVHFSGNSCRVCDCGIDKEKHLLNKLFWKDQHCPDNPSRW